MIDKEAFLKHLYLVLDQINLAVSNTDREILLIALVGLTCLFCLVRLFRIWKRKSALKHKQESFKLRIEQVLRQSKRFAEVYDPWTVPVMIFDDFSSLVSEIGKASGAGPIMFWLVTIVSTFWTINWIIHKSTSKGYLWSFVRVVSMWVLVMYFFLNRDISRVHLIWAAPAAFVFGLLVSGLLKKTIKGVDGWKFC